MNFMKLILGALILLSLMQSVPAQRRRNKNPNYKAKSSIRSITNHPPVINSFTTSLSEVFAPCPWLPTSTGCEANNSCTILLSVIASDLDGDPLFYKYTVTGGTLIKEAAQARWNLSGLSPGTYNATVKVKDKQGDLVSKAISVTVRPYPNCDPPCITLIVDCPSEVEEGTSVIFTANISGGESDVKPTFVWKISSGAIINGQGTNTIKVDTSNLSGQQVEATIKVSGYSPSCSNEASGKVQVQKKAVK